MAMGGRMVVVVVVAFVCFLQCAEAAYGNSMEFSTSSGLSPEDLSVWQSQIVDTENQFMDVPTRRTSPEDTSMWQSQIMDTEDQFQDVPTRQMSPDGLSMWETHNGDAEVQFLDEPTRRLLAVRRRSYISYGALDGNRSPCPARSGRSYYTPNCADSRGPVDPYRRGCYQITRCARG